MVGDGRQADLGINASRGVWYFICTEDGPAQLQPVWRPEMIVFTPDGDSSILGQFTAAFGGLQL